MILFLTRIELLPIKKSADIRTERPLMTMHCVIIAALHARGDILDSGASVPLM